VVRREAHVAIEEKLQPRLELFGHRARALAPEDPVVAEDELGTGRGSVLEQLAVRRDPGDHELDLVRPGHLEAVGAVVGAAGRLEQIVEEGDQLVATGHRCNITGGTLGYRARPGVPSGRTGAADSVGRGTTGGSRGNDKPFGVRGGCRER